MPEVGRGLDRLEWHKIGRLMKKICAQSNLIITVYDQNKDEQSQKWDETPVHSALGQAQRQNEALSKLIEWIERGKSAHVRRITRTSQALLANQQPTLTFTTPRWLFVPKVRKWRQ